MTIVRNPFDAGGYSLAEMTQAINILPNLYTRLGQIGLFRFEGVTQRSVIIEQYEGVLNLLPSVPLGGPATVGTREGRSMRSFALPWIPHDDVILPGDIQGQPALGVFDGADPLVEVMNRKLQLMRRKHAQTREYMEMNALRGIVKDGAGTTLYNYFTEFGLAQISVDFVLGTAGTNVQGKVREVLRAMEDNILGESMTDVHALVSREFFDKLIAHPKTEEAYKFYAATGAQPLRQDVRRNFPFAGIVFEEYSGTVTLSTKATERLVPASEGIAFPLGTMDTFTTYGGPANLLEAANTMGLPLYARQHLDEKGRWIDLMTEASILPVNKRPRIAIRIHTSNWPAMTVFAAAMDRIYANPSMAATAVWISAITSEEHPIRVIRRAPDRITEFGAGRFVSDTMMVDVRVSDLPDPRTGDLIVIGADSFTIQGEPVRDRERLIWTLDLRPS